MQLIPTGPCISRQDVGHLSHKCLGILKGVLGINYEYCSENNAFMMIGNIFMIAKYRALLPGLLKI